MLIESEVVDNMIGDLLVDRMLERGYHIYGLMIYVLYAFMMFEYVSYCQDL